MYKNKSFIQIKILHSISLLSNVCQFFYALMLGATMSHHNQLYTSVYALNICWGPQYPTQRSGTL